MDVKDVELSQMYLDKINELNEGIKDKDWKIDLLTKQLDDLTDSWIKRGERINEMACLVNELQEKIDNDIVKILEEEPRNIEVCGTWFTKSEYDKLAQSEEQKKIPEKLDEYIHTDSLNYNQCNYMFEKLTNKYNEIIDYLKSKGE